MFAFKRRFASAVAAYLLAEGRGRPGIFGVSQPENR
jgi:hypothetical protein